MKVTLEQLKEKPMPEHIAIIMDGNGRWAKGKGLVRAVGHRFGVQALKNTIIALDELGIGHLTVYAFSTENWKRPKDEVDALMELISEFINKEIDYLDEKGVRVNPIGEISALSPKALQSISYAREKTKHNSHIIFNVALNYGGRQEILRATKAICTAVKQNELQIEEIDDAIFSSYLYTAGQPDPDLVIRSSGELRISNFLLWQIAYSEIWVTDILWPDFKKEDLWQAIWEYQNRDRRYGGIGR